MENKGYPHHSLIICGAGISRKDPTCLPLGEDLTKFYLTHTCGKKACDQLLNTTDHLGEYLNRSIVLPRLETIIGSIAEIDNVRNVRLNRSRTMLHGFEAFQCAPFNENHIYLAKLCLAGNTILTFNFDVCIEKAIETITGTGVVFRKESGVPTAIYRNVNKTIHLHGICNSITTMGATIATILNGLPVKFEARFKELISKAEDVIFIGYSFSDFFDFVPFLKGMEGLLQNKTVTYVNHMGWDKAIENKLRQLFPDLIFSCVDADTSDYLYQITGGDRYTSQVDSFVWKDSFINHAGIEYTENEMLVNTAKVGKSLGIMPTIMTDLSWTELFAKLKVLIHTTASNEELGLISSLAYDNGDINSYKYYRSFMSNRNTNLVSEAEDIRLYKPKCSFDELIEEYRRPIKIHYRHILDLRTYYTQIYDEVHALILKNDIFEYLALSDESKRRIDAMTELFDFLIKSSYKKFTGISQYASIISVRYILDALKSGVANKDLINEEIQIYSELSAYSSLGRAYFHAANMYAYLYFSSKQIDMLATAKRHFEQSRHILKTCGYEEYLNEKCASDYFKYLSSVWETLIPI